MKTHLKIILILLVSLIVLSGVVTAEKSITIDSPATALNDKCTLPVVIHDAEAVSAFTIYVPNNISGTIITINESATRDEHPDAIINSNVDSSEQIITWFTGNNPINGDNTLFWIDVEAKENSLDSVPVSIDIVDIYNEQITQVRQLYPTTKREVSFTSQKANVEKQMQEAINEGHNTADKTPVGEKATPGPVSTDTVQVTGASTPQKTVSATSNPTGSAKPETTASYLPPKTDTESTQAKQTSPVATPASPLSLFGVLTALGVFTLNAYLRRQ